MRDHRDRGALVVELVQQRVALRVEEEHADADEKNNRYELANREDVCDPRGVSNTEEQRPPESHGDTPPLTVVLLVILSTLALIKFGYLDRRVHYQ